MLFGQLAKIYGYLRRYAGPAYLSFNPMPNPNIAATRAKLANSTPQLA